MMKRVLVLCIALWLTMTPDLVLGFESTPPEPGDAGVSVLQSDDRAVMLELSTPSCDLEERALDGTVYHRLAVEGLAHSGEEGHPQLPVKETMVAVPPDADLAVRVLETDSVLLPGPYNVQPSPKMVVPPDAFKLPGAAKDSPVTGVAFVFAKDEATYTSDALYPGRIAALVSSGFIRDRRFARLELRPFQINPVSGELRWHKRMTVEVSFTYDGKRTQASAGTGEPDTLLDELGTGPFEKLMGESLVNAESARAWRGQATSGLARIRGPNPPASQPSWRVGVDHDGIYRLSYADLSAQGFPAGVSSPTLKLFNQGSEVAIIVQDADGAFGSGDIILFYGQGLDTKFTETNVYWLTYGGGPGQRMSIKDGGPSGTAPVPSSFGTTKHAERNNSRITTIRMTPNGENWYWGGVSGGRNFSFNLENVAMETYSATLRADMHGYYDTTRQTKLYVNGNLVEDASWTGFVDRVSTVQFPSSYLSPGSNTLRIETSSLVLFNWLEVDYRRTYGATGDSLFFAGDEAGTWEFQVSPFSTDDVEVYDITDPTNVSRIVNSVVDAGTLKFEDAIGGRHDYVALTTAQQKSPASIERDTSSNLRANGNGADWIAITHADFFTDVLPLAQHRTSQGLRTAVVDVQDIYDEFSYGVFTPQAIQDFLAYAYENWVPLAPRYVLLVGNGNFDFRCYYRCEPNYIPPYLAYVNDRFGEAAADNRFVAVSGDDIFPDMAIGRLPVSTSAEAAVVVDKILAYEQSPPAGDWNERVLLVADNQPDKADNAGNFWDLSDDVVGNHLPAPYMAQRVYYDKYADESVPGHPDPPRQQPPYYPTAEGAKRAITETVNGGALLVNQIGHSNRERWAHENIFERADISSLNNDGKLPLFLEMTCLTSDFSFPGLECIDGTLLRTEGRGSVATWGCTTLGVASGHHFLDTGFLDAVFEEDVREIGRAAVAGKLNLFANSSQHLNLIDTYTIFGDPAMRLNTLFSDVSIAKAADAPEPLRPGGTLTYTLTYANAGPATAHNVVISDILPTQLVEPLAISSSTVITPHEGTRFVWDVPDLAAGEGGTITIRATVSPTATGSFSNTASIASTAREANMADNATAPLVRDVVPFPVGGLTYPASARAATLRTMLAHAGLTGAALGLLITLGAVAVVGIAHARYRGSDHAD